MDAIGLDIGHRAVKVCAGTESIIFPSAVCPEIDPALATDTAIPDADIALINGKYFWVGNSALTHADSYDLDALKGDWFESDEYLALMVSGHKRAIASLGSTDAILVLGLPPQLYARQHERVTQLAIMHLGLPGELIRVIGQPYGAYMATLFDKTVEPEEGSCSMGERWLIIDVGYCTVDFGLSVGRRWSVVGEKSIGGTNVIATDLRDRIYAEHSIFLPLHNCDDILSTRTSKLRDKPVNLDALVTKCSISHAQNIEQTAMRLFGDKLCLFSGVLIAGGGAGLVYPHLRERWPHAATAPAPLFAAADGMRRYGLRARNA